MNELKIAAKIQVCCYNDLLSVEKNLADAAKKAVTRSYAPYSKFQVGAAVLLANGEIVTGSNQENIAYPSGLCAERTALFYANSRFPDEAVDMIAVAAFTNGDFTEEPVPPCGSCRQVILEAQNRYKHPVKMLLCGKNEIYRIEKITDLLPLSFSHF
ncbi:MAG: cytidine deaminase [Dysgonamonadaceae bacterium]|jgi:cytidine deaminase|nr:cytidine deaminase [Dysgonamonadaceae bacterium]